MNTPARILLPLLLLAAGLGAQASGEATFTLAAGEHRLRDLVELTATIRKAPIAAGSAATAALLDERRVRVQRELRLGGDALVDVASNLLFEAGVILATAPGTGEPRVVSIEDRDALTKCARRVDRADVTALAARVDFVETRLPFATDRDKLHVNMLRPFLGFSNQPWHATMRVDAEAQEMVMTGTTPQVAAALRVMQSFAGDTPTQPARPRWRDGTHDWTGGDALLADFVATFCETLDANVLGELPVVMLALGDAREHPTKGWYEAATVTLHAAGYVLEPLCAEHRVFALRNLEHRPTELSWRARHETVDELSASRAVEPVMVVFHLQTMASTAAINRLRPKMAGMKVSVGSMVTSPNDLVIDGLRPDVQEFVELLLKLDSH